MYCNAFDGKCVGDTLVDRSVVKHVATLLGTLCLAVGSAAVLVAYLVYNYGATGRYQLKNVLLEPAVLENLSYVEGGKRMVFQEIQFFHQEAGQWKRQKVPLSAYKKFYAKVASDSSLLSIPDGVENDFRRGDIASLVLKLTPESGSDSMGMSFQELHFSGTGDHYRVELHVDEKNGTWAYFHRPGVYQWAVELFNE